MRRAIEFLIDYLRWRANRPVFDSSAGWPDQRRRWLRNRPRYRRTSGVLIRGVAQYRDTPPWAQTWDRRSS